MDESRNRINKLAARLMLEIDPADEEQLAGYFKDILDFFHALDQVSSPDSSLGLKLNETKLLLREDDRVDPRKQLKPADLSPGYDRDTRMFQVQPVINKSSPEDE
jgi:Asp-tRNA(Asn)/Glu-tRNA(Gln) amidotransferase C subunit